MAINFGSAASKTTFPTVSAAKLEPEKGMTLGEQAQAAYGILRNSSELRNKWEFVLPLSFSLSGADVSVKYPREASRAANPEHVAQARADVRRFLDEAGYSSVEIKMESQVG
jgi:hypothetical protein